MNSRREPLDRPETLSHERIATMVESAPELLRKLDAHTQRGTQPLNRRQELIHRGYTRVSQVLGGDELTQGLALAQQLLARTSGNRDRARHISIGSLIDVLVAPLALDLITWPRAFAILGALGFSDPRFLHGMLFEKAPYTPRTFWHQDGTLWNDPISYGETPHELILLYYLVDTSVGNGALRVIPGSHRKRHSLHAWLAQSSVEQLRRHASADDPAFHTYADEESVPVAAGDLVVMDARLLHAAHANSSGAPRPALSLWYAPDVDGLPERVRARFSQTPREGCRLPYLPASWSGSERSRLTNVLPPRYSGTASPLPDENNPGARLT